MVHFELLICTVKRSENGNFESNFVKIELLFFTSLNVGLSVSTVVLYALSMLCWGKPVTQLASLGQRDKTEIGFLSSLLRSPLLLLLL